MAWNNFADLTPEQMAEIRRQMATPRTYAGHAEGEQEQDTTPAFAFFDSGNGDGTGRYFALGPNGLLQGYDMTYGGDPGKLNGQQYSLYDDTGKNAGTGIFKDIAGRSAMDFIAPLSMVALPFAAAMFPAVNAALSFGANPVLAAEGAGAAGAAGAVGGGTLAGGAGMDTAGFEGLTAADIGGSTAAGGGGLGTGSGAFLGEGVASGVPAWDAAATKAGLSLSGAGAGTGLLSGASKLLGPAATLLGAAAGAKGQKTNQTQTRDIPEWLKPSVAGLLSQTDNLLQRQMAPGALQGYDDMQRIGRGLLNSPVAGNGFGLFGRY